MGLQPGRFLCGRLGRNPEKISQIQIKKISSRMRKVPSAILMGCDESTLRQRQAVHHRRRLIQERAPRGGGLHRGARSGKSIQARPLIWAGYMRRPPHARTGEGMKFTRASTSEHLPDGPSASVLPSSPAMSCCTACGPGDQRHQSSEREVLQELYSQIQGRARHLFAPLAYSSVYIVAEGIKAAGTTETGPLVKALEQTKFVSPLGEVITFKPSNIIKHQALHGRRYSVAEWHPGSHLAV